MNSSHFPQNENDHIRVAIKDPQITVPPEGRATIQVGILNEGPSED